MPPIDARLWAVWILSLLAAVVVFALWFAVMEWIAIRRSSSRTRRWICPLVAPALEARMVTTHLPLRSQTGLLELARSAPPA